MALSLNHVESLTRKAVRGAGLYWGLAEDAGRAVRRLEMAGLPAMGWLADLLKRMDHQDPAALTVHVADDGWHGPGEIITPLLAGPSLGDWAWARRNGRDEVRLRLHQVVCPALCAGYASVAAVLGGRPIRLDWESCILAIFPDRLEISGIPDPEGPCTVDMTLGEPTNMPGGSYRTWPFHTVAREIDPCVLEALESLAFRTYVEASESSRLAGAGAGLSDND